MLYERKSAALAVKGRKGRKQVAHEVAATTEVEPSKRKAAKSKAKAVAPVIVSGGKGRKTGMVLARAKLGTATSDIAATRDRQGAQLSKGRYRDAEKTGREAPTGTLNTASMPKRKGAKSKATHKAAMHA